MHRRTARGNRVGLGALGLLLALAGAALFAAYHGWYPSEHVHASIYPAVAGRWVHRNGSWLWPVVAAVAIALGLVFVRWLLVQPRVDRLTQLRVDTDATGTSSGDGAPAEGDDGAGRTRMPADAVNDVVEDDIAALRGVRRASATISGRSDAPELWLRVATNADADIGRIRRTIVDEVVRDARACLDVPTLPTYLTLVVTRRDSPRDVR